MSIHLSQFKDFKMTGANKRAAPEVILPSKRTRFSDNVDTPAMPSCPVEHVTNIVYLDSQSRSPGPRRKLTPRRKAVSITDWLLNSPVPSPRRDPPLMPADRPSALATPQRARGL